MVHLDVISPQKVMQELEKQKKTKENRSVNKGRGNFGTGHENLWTNLLKTE